MKKCNKCLDQKSLDSFHHNKQYKDGRAPRCKQCTKFYMATRIIKPKE